jgi:hypothetical protein
MKEHVQDFLASRQKRRVKILAGLFTIIAIVSIALVLK